MKPNLSFVGLFLIMSSLLLAPLAHAKAERIVIKKETTRAKQEQARASLKNIDLRRIEDAETRQAVSEILNYLNLQTQK